MIYKIPEKIKTSSFRMHKLSILGYNKCRDECQPLEVDVDRLPEILYYLNGGKNWPYAGVATVKRYMKMSKELAQKLNAGELFKVKESHAKTEG